MQYLFTGTGPACQIHVMDDSVAKIPRGRRSHRLWQELVDSAHALLTIDSCRQYGLVTGGPECDAERCRKILVEGRARGFSPRRDSFERFVAALDDDSLRAIASSAVPEAFAHLDELVKDWKP